MRRRKQASGGSLDSLLDTMTNVVGILVIVLVITQLGVRDAVDRISASSSVRPETLAEAQKEAEELRALRERLAMKQKILSFQGEAKSVLRLEELEQNKTDYQREVQALREELERKKREAELEARKREEQTKEQLAEHEKKVKTLLAQISEAEQELAKLRAQLAITPEPGALPAKQISLPNPRSAPKGTQPVILLCREERLIYVDLEAIRERAQKKAEYLVGRKRLDRNPAGIDGKQLAEEFNRSVMREGDFNLKLTVPGHYPQIVLERRSGAGETTDQLQRSSSRYQMQLRRLDPKKQYLRFLVWPDSFETYLAAREIASERGFMAGWDATTTKGEYTVGLGGKIRCGAPPPPTSPKSPSSPTPPKPLPIDVID